MAIRRDDEIWLGADTRITDGDFIIDYQISNNSHFHHSLEMDSKLILLDNAIIGAAGDVTMRNFLEVFVSKQKNKSFIFDQKLDVIQFFINFKKFLIREGGLGASAPNEIQGMQNTAWLVATHARIFTVDHDGAVLEYPEFCVVGSGAQSARAVIEYMLEYEPRLSARKILERAHKIAIKQNLTCGGPQIQMNVTTILNSVPH